MALVRLQANFSTPKVHYVKNYVPTRCRTDLYPSPQNLLRLKTLRNFAGLKNVKPPRCTSSHLQKRKLTYATYPSS